MEVQKYAREGRDVILIGHQGHPEVEGTMGRFDHVLRRSHPSRRERCPMSAQLEVRDPQRLAFVTQTTLSVDDTAEIVGALRKRFPSLATPRKEDICYATQNRQDAVKKLLEQCDVLLVVGSRTSSNSNRLRELADRAGVPGYLIDGPEDLRAEWFVGKLRRRSDGRRVSAGAAGAAGGRAAAELGWREATRGRWARGACGVRVAARVAARHGERRGGVNVGLRGLSQTYGKTFRIHVAMSAISCGDTECAMGYVCHSTGYSADARIRRVSSPSCGATTGSYSPCAMKMGVA